MASSPPPAAAKKGKGRESVKAPAWPPAWAVPPWPLFSDADVNKERWDVGRVAVPKDPLLANSGVASPSHEGSPKGRGSEKGSPPGGRPKGKGRNSSENDELMFLPFEDPLGPGALPASLAGRVAAWVRGAEVPGVALLSPEEEAKGGADARDPPDLAACNPLALQLSPLLRSMVSSIRSLYLLGRDEPLPLEASDDYAPDTKAPWRPWHCIYALCEASSAHPPTPAFNPAGKYVVRVHVLGAWRRVTVDDRLPEDAQGRPLLPVLLPAPPATATASASADSTASLAPPPCLRIWPAILCKALLRVASLSWRGGEAGELAGFDAVACLTGWVPQHLDLRGLPPSVCWALLHKLMLPDAEEREQQFRGYVSPEEEQAAKELAEALLIPSKYNFPKRPRVPPPSFDLPLKDEGLWEARAATDPEAERLAPAAVLALLREDLRSAPSSPRPPSSASWSLDLDNVSLSVLDAARRRLQEAAAAAAAAEEARAKAGVASKGSGEAARRTPSSAQTAEEEAAFFDAASPGSQLTSSDFMEHLAVAPRWEHAVLVREARIVVVDEGCGRPATPLWRRHRWKQWAVERGLVPPLRERLERRLRVFAPLCGVVQIPPPPTPPGPLHPPVLPPPLPLGYPWPYWPTGSADPRRPKKPEESKLEAEEGRSKVGESRLGRNGKAEAGAAGAAGSQAAATKPLSGKAAAATPAPAPGPELEVSDMDEWTPWVRFELLQSELLALQVYHRPSEFAHRARLTSLTPANVAAQGSLLGADSPAAAHKKPEKGKGGEKPSTPAKNDKLPMPPEEFGTEPLYFYMDSMSCKKVLFYLCVASDEVLRNYSIQLDAADPEKWLLQEVQSLVGPRTPYESHWRSKNVSPAHLLAEEYRWAEGGLGQQAFALKTNGARALLVHLPEGIAVLRLWVKAPRHFSLLVLSPTAFALGRRMPAHALLMKESASYTLRGAALADAYNALLAAPAAPPLRLPPSPHSALYRKAALQGEEASPHGKALRDLYEALLPPFMPPTTPAKTERIWVKLINRLEEALVWALLEKAPAAEDAARAVRQWQVALQEPFFGLSALCAFEERGAPGSLRLAPEETPEKAPQREALAALAGAARRLLAMDAPDVAKGHPGADECDRDPLLRSPSEEEEDEEDEEEVGKGSGRASKKSLRPRESKLAGLGEPVITLDQDSAIVVIKRMLTPQPDLLRLYPFRNDHLHRMYCTEYRGTTKVVTHEWCPLLRCVVNPHQERPVLCSIFACAPGHGFPWVVVVDNETAQPIAAPTRYGSVEPFLAQRSDSGYTVLVVLPAPRAAKDIVWMVQFAATKPENTVHCCRDPATSGAQRQGREARGGRGSLHRESRSSSRRVSHTLSVSESSTSLRRQTAPRAGSRMGSESGLLPGPAPPAAPPPPAEGKGLVICPGPQPPPQLLVLETRGIYTAPSDGVVACALLKLPLVGVWQPTLLLSFHLRLSSPSAQFRFTVEDLDSGEMLLDTVGHGHKTVPAFFLQVPTPPLEGMPLPVAPKLTIPGMAGMSEAALRLAAQIAGLRVPSPRMRGVSAGGQRPSLGTVLMMLRLTVHVRVGDWPLTPSELDAVQQGKAQEREQAQLFGERGERSGSGVDVHGTGSIAGSIMRGVSQRHSVASIALSNVSVASSASNTPSQSGALPKAKRRSSNMKGVLAAGAGAGVGAGKRAMDMSAAPTYLLVAVVDAERAPRAELLGDTPRAVFLRSLKEQWEDAAPGRHARAEKARQAFQKRREDGDHLLALATVSQFAEEAVAGATGANGAFDAASEQPGGDQLAELAPKFDTAQWTVTEALPPPDKPPSSPPPPPPSPTQATRAGVGATAGEGEEEGEELPRPPPPQRPIVRTRKAMLDELLRAAEEEAGAGAGAEGEEGRPPPPPVVVTALDVHLRSFDIDNAVERERSECRQLLDRVLTLRGVQGRVGAHAAAALERSEAHAAEAHAAAQELREQALADAKQRAKDKGSQQHDGPPALPPQPNAAAAAQQPKKAKK